MRRRLSHLLLWPLLAILAVFTARAETEYDVKAAFTVRFADYVQWPAKKANIIIGIVGRDPFGGAFQRILADSPDAARRIRVRTISATDIAALQSCDILFISNSEADRIGTVLKAIAGQPVLAVSDIESFEAQGGAISFMIRNSRVKFKVNESVATAQGLKLDKDLVLRSAR